MVKVGILGAAGYTGGSCALRQTALQGFLLHARGLHALLRRQSMKYSVCPDNRDIPLKPSHWLQSDMVLPYLLHPVREVFRLYR